MNALLTGVLGLIIGLFSGAQFSDKNSDVTIPQESNNNKEQVEVVASDDFVSMRPQAVSAAYEEVSLEEKEGLLFMREEEKLARDVYSTLYDKWNNQIFANIAQSEQTHTEAVRQLLEKYNIEDPVKDDTVGVFVNPELKELYTNLVAQGMQSEAEALKVGALIEDLDIKDLNVQLAQTNNSDIKAVYENLLRGSRNHIRAFTKQLTRIGVAYEPQYISSEEFQTIAQSEQERGGGGWGGGQAGGRGR